MKQRNRSEAGVTLMELLIAVTLLSMVSVGMLFALRIGLNTYAKAQQHMMDDRRVAGAQRVLTDQLEGMMPLQANCGGGGLTPFFQGGPDRMRLISTYSLQGSWRGRPQILEYLVIPDDSGVGGVRLVVNETPYVHPRQAGQLCTAPGKYLPISTGPNSFVLADHLALCRFSYATQEDDMLKHPIWAPAFGGRTWPVGVRVEMAPLVPDFSKLQPVTVVAPLRIHRLPEIPYVDQ
ncbi:MAG TPA: prepilin-type N-terminal cleavage/methylation domain-containing protein [Candidatus Solibacter sp.]|nr:prepilin-type N-terminal cleavage/methylation domain-containing protein [Candidatus Solibacter sp.]